MTRTDAKVILVIAVLGLGPLSTGCTLRTPTRDRTTRTRCAPDRFAPSSSTRDKFARSRSAAPAVVIVKM